MGPFELMDLTGIDVTLAAATGVWEGLGRPDRLRPSPIQEALVAAGHLGRKTGQGFYGYADGARDRRGRPPARSPAQASTSTAAQIRTRILAAIAAEARLAAAEGRRSAAMSSTSPCDLARAIRADRSSPRSTRCPSRGRRAPTIEP